MLVVDSLCAANLGIQGLVYQTTGRCYVEVSADAFATTPVSVEVPAAPSSQLATTPISVSLAVLVGKTVQIRLRQVPWVYSAPMSWTIHNVAVGALGKACAKAEDCDDSNPCTSESCTFGKCTQIPLSVQKEFDWCAPPANIGIQKGCYYGEICQAGQCKSANSYSGLGNSNFCLDPYGGCGGYCKFDQWIGFYCQTKFAGYCDDNNNCTSGDTCTGYYCAGKAKCDDLNPCNIDSCAAATGQCSAVPGNDGVACGGGKLCLGGLCQ